MPQEFPEGTVTVRFTDVEGSTDLTTRLGDEAAREVLGACEKLIRQQVAPHRGQEVKRAGNGVMLAFTSARRAVASAADAQRARAWRNRREAAHAVRLRIGLDTGEVSLLPADLFGATVTAVARIANHANRRAKRADRRAGYPAVRCLRQFPPGEWASAWLIGSGISGRSQGASHEGAVAPNEVGVRSRYPRTSGTPSGGT